MVLLTGFSEALDSPFEFQPFAPGAMGKHFTIASHLCFVPH